MIHRRSIGQGFGQMATQNVGRALQIRNGSSKPQCAMEAARGKAEFLGRFSHQIHSAGIQMDNLLDKRRRRGGIAQDIWTFEPIETLALQFSRHGHSRGDFGRSL